MNNAYNVFGGMLNLTELDLYSVVYMWGLTFIDSKGSPHSIWTLQIIEIIFMFSERERWFLTVMIMLVTSIC